MRREVAGDEPRVVARTPTVEEYLRLRAVAGLSAKPEGAARAGLPNTVFAVVVERGARAIGMGRIIGDGGLFLQVVDIAVEPQAQGRGLGKAILATLTTHLRENHAGAYVSLIADGEAKRLYAQFGFVETAPASVGMALVL